MSKRIISILAIALFVGMVAGAQAQRYGDEYRDASCFGQMGHKLGRGLVNICTSCVEIPKHISMEWRKTDPCTGIVVGGVEGIGWCCVRVAVGAYDVVTFPVPVPANYEPLMLPEYPLPDVWGEQLPYFDRDGDPRLTL